MLKEARKLVQDLFVTMNLHTHEIEIQHVSGESVYITPNTEETKILFNIYFTRGLESAKGTLLYMLDQRGMNGPRMMLQKLTDDDRVIDLIYGRVHISTQ